MQWYDRRVHGILYSTLLYSTTSIYILYPRMFIVCRREVVGCVFLTLYLLFVSVDGWMDGWLCRVDMVGVSFFLFEEKHCVPNLCVSTPLHYSFYYLCQELFSTSCLIFLLL